MQKKLLVLAVAGLVTAPAFADSSVTLYGLIDAGYSWRGDNYDANKSSRSGIDSGQLNGSRLGVKGSEDISPGVKGIFQIEAGIAADTGSSNQGGLTWGRQVFAGVETNGVTVSFGRQYTPAFNLYATADPFGLGGVAEANNIFTHVVARADNSVYVNTPFYGDVFAVEAMYSTKVSGGEAAGNVGDTRYASIFPKFKLGPAVIEAGYSQSKVHDVPGNSTAIDIGTIIDFKVATLSLAYARVSSPSPRVPADDKLKYDRAHIGAVVPLGNFSLLASYNYSKDKNQLDDKASQIGIGGTYALSKRTALYGVFARIDTQPGAEATQAYEVADATNGGFGYRKGVNLGLRHTF